MAQEKLAARVRTTKGKEAARKLRKNGKIPAVYYIIDDSRMANAAQGLHSTYDILLRFIGQSEI